MRTAENRLERRKMRTRAALIRAAQSFMASGNLNVPVLEITRAADVGMGSFHNHFDSKEQLFQAAINEVLDAHGALLDKLTDEHEHPAETFARSFRLTGRLFRRRPDMSRVLLNSGLALICSDRFAVDDPALALALAVAGGALMGLGQLLHDQPECDAAEAADRVTRDVLIMFGMAPDEAAEICRGPVPDLDELTEPDSAA